MIINEFVERKMEIYGLKIRDITAIKSLDKRLQKTK